MRLAVAAVIQSKWFHIVLTLTYATIFVYQVIYSSTQSIIITHHNNVQPTYKSITSSSSSSPSFSVDILSVASINRTDLLKVQETIFKSHPIVRNFFNATEIDDYDPTCYKDITFDHVYKVSSFCRRRRNVPRLSRQFSVMRNMYARHQWLSTKPNPTGWLCAIQRPYSGLKKVYQHYQVMKQSYPDYFIIFDDDSYYNMDTFYKQHSNINSTRLSVTAGCLVRQPIHLINFTFPFGGFGAVFSKGSMEYLFTPIICPLMIIGNGTIPMLVPHTNSEAICHQLSQDLFFELQYFQQGDSLFDLIYKYVNVERYRDVDSWNVNGGGGFCMHSDWVMGYFINYYNVSEHVVDPYYKHTAEARIESYQGSEIYAHPSGMCKNERNCPIGSDICHKPSIDWMLNEAKNWKMKINDTTDHQSR